MMPGSPSTRPFGRGAGGREGWLFLTRPGAWFWALLAVGLIARVLLATATDGTPDVRLWRRHASAVANQGLTAHYALDPLFNHPPAMGWAMSRVFLLSREIGVPFPSLYRLVVALVDFASVVLIVRVLRESRWRFVAGAAYAVAPVALVLGAQHGNTDALIATGLLFATLLAAARRPIATGVAIGVICSIKVPGLFAAPAVGFALPRWRDRVICALVALAVVVPPYAWASVQGARYASARPDLGLDRGFALERIFLYHGYLMVVKGTPPVWLWGLKSLASPVLGPQVYRWPRAARWWVRHSHYVALPLMGLFAFLRRRENSAPAIAASVAGTYAIFYALVEAWATQYLAWAAPFWMLAGWPFAVATNLAAGGYIYFLYALRSDDWLLRPRWRTDLTSADWPASLTVLRDLALLVFLAFAVYWFARAIGAEWRAWRQTRPTSRPEARPMGRDQRRIAGAANVR